MVELEEVGCEDGADAVACAGLRVDFEMHAISPSI
jgi:hypothetical protein